MKPQSKLNSQEQAQEQSAEQQTQRPALEFATPEEMLRHDALHTPVPPALASRLKESLAQLPAPARRPWWRRLLGQ